jgi:hypothetical protein
MRTSFRFYLCVAASLCAWSVGELLASIRRGLPTRQRA